MGVAVLVQQDVGRLEVAVNHAALVRVVDGLSHLHHERGRLAQREGSAGQALGQALPFDEAHGEIMLPLMLADLVDRHDPRMVQVGRRLGLDGEPANGDLVGELTRQDHLERYGPIQAHLAGLEDDAHAAAGDLADDLVVPEVADAGRLGLGVRGGLVEPRGPGQVVRRLGRDERHIVPRWTGSALIDRRGRPSGPPIDGGRRGAEDGWTGSGVRGLGVQPLPEEAGRAEALGGVDR
jgi:hypothetical protein